MNFKQLKIALAQGKAELGSAQPKLVIIFTQRNDLKDLENVHQYQPTV